MVGEEIKWENRCINKKHNGADFLRIIVRCPCGGQVGDFFREAAEMCAAWAENELFTKLCWEYDGSSEPRKRFMLPWKYIFEVETEGGAPLKARLCVSLSKKREPVAAKSYVYIFGEDGVLRRPRSEMLKRRAENVKKGKST